MNEDNRTNALKNLQTETERLLRQILGDKILADFNRETGGWLANLAKH